MLKSPMHKTLILTSLVLALLAPPVQATELEVINLYDAFGDTPKGAVQDFGFSALVRYRGKTILFDSGTNADKFKQNTEALGIDLAEVDFAVGSHAHLDHTGGFDYLLKKNPKVKIYMAADTFGANAPLNFEVAGKEPNIVKKLPQRERYFEGKSTTAKLEGNGRFYNAVKYVSKTTQIAPGITLVATTSPFMGYFSKYPDTDLAGKKATAKGAKLLPLPELSLSLETKEGEVVLVGCSHSTVETIVAAVKEATQKSVRLLAGGYHLLPYDRKAIGGIVGRLKKLGVKQVAPAHCTGHLAFKLLRDAYAKDYLFFGLGEKLMVK
jgi:7,8-dihydropterin-6-yl-methyl-4-(beta-D-ribofuranosyl)aminobenzene 5'-phosphate synthase